MVSQHIDDPASIAKRFRLIRRAYGALQHNSAPMSQSEFARLCGIGVAAWNNAETGDNRIGLDNAMALRRITGATLDYVFCGDIAAMPHSLMIEIEKLDNEEPPRGSHAQQRKNRSILPSGFDRRSALKMGRRAP